MRGAILAGGLASRFDGKPKGLERVGGVRIIDRVADALLTVTTGTALLVANDPAAGEWREDLAVVPDRIAGQGSLGGIYTAVAAGEGPVLVVAWDMPFVPPALLAQLVSGSAGFDVYLPDSGGPRGVEPLCGVYGPACEPAIRDCLSRGERGATAFHGSVRTGTLPRPVILRHGDPHMMFFNVNAADDLQEAEALWNRRE
jgi:molybdenum cofactor guanylyltransferase